MLGMTRPFIHRFFIKKVRNIYKLNSIISTCQKESEMETTINVEEIDRQTRLVVIQYRFYGCDPVQLDDKDEILKIASRFVKLAGMENIGQCIHEFDPQGMTGGVLGVVFLAESHIFIHTWPELSYAYVHVAACQPKDLHSAVSFLKNRLKHEKCLMDVLMGGKYVEEDIR